MSDSRTASPYARPHGEVWSDGYEADIPLSPGARLLARSMARPRDLVRKLVIGDAIGERPSTTRLGARGRK